MTDLPADPETAQGSDRPDLRVTEDPASGAAPADPVVAAEIAADLAAVDAALERIESGDYGRCRDCGDPLDDDLLASDPTASVCARHLALEDAPSIPEQPYDPGFSVDDDRN